MLERIRAANRGPEAELSFVHERALPGGSVEIVYSCV